MTINEETTVVLMTLHKDVLNTIKQYKNSLGDITSSEIIHLIQDISQLFANIGRGQKRREMKGQTILKAAEEIRRLREVLDEIQEEWDISEGIHRERYPNQSGMRSSQISALVSYLIKKKVI